VTAVAGSQAINLKVVARLLSVLGSEYQRTGDRRFDLARAALLGRKQPGGRREIATDEFLIRDAIRAVESGEAKSMRAAFVRIAGFRNLSCKDEAALVKRLQKKHAAAKNCAAFPVLRHKMREGCSGTLEISHAIEAAERGEISDQIAGRNLARIRRAGGEAE
jgi:hypothetical protein